MSSRDDRREDELEERLDELEDVLGELRRDLEETDRDRRGPPRPPSLSDLVRFTEQYTIPTVIALLETTIKSLELLRGTLRLADPGRSVAGDADGTADRLADVRDGASAGLARSLSELRTALSEADLPEEAASRSIIADARDLTAEIESRIEEGRREADAARREDRRDDRRSGRDDDGERETGGRETADRDERGGRDDPSAGGRGIRIDVTDPDADSGEAADDEPEDDPAPEVDVESELESIKRQIDGDAADGEPDPDGDGADGEAGDSATEGEAGGDDPDDAGDRDAD
ncbi:hypothetical protein ACFQMF_11705 [Halorubrum rutilum]|uniref:Uncharacterized protein n=1 Tax=Halorubrum rutilum TaxID=1364933 RepID=A0ABD6AMK0_9EURY|nr:hypothetical protein [Halorubrum rutilum]